MSIIKDGLNASGWFRLEVYENGVHKETFEQKNLVVTLGHQNIARLLGGHASGKKIEKISVGTSPTDPVLGNTTITGAFTKALGGATYPETNSVLFSFDIDNDEANGMVISEFGLLNTDNVLCARKVRAGEITKTSAIRLVGTWKITIN